MARSIPQAQSELGVVVQVKQLSNHKINKTQTYHLLTFDDVFHALHLAERRVIKRIKKGLGNKALVAAASAQSQPPASHP